MRRSLLVAFATAAAIVLTTVSAQGQPRARLVNPKPAGKSNGRMVLSPVQEELRRNTVLSNTLRVRMPEGTDLTSAASGFRRLELFVATVHASNNLAVPFVELKRRIVNDGMTLGQAIQDILPRSRYWSEARRAEDDAAAMIRTSEAVALASEKQASR
jgi:hypothetical protein